MGNRRKYIRTMNFIITPEVLLKAASVGRDPNGNRHCIVAQIHDGGTYYISPEFNRGKTYLEIHQPNSGTIYMLVDDTDSWVAFCQLEEDVIATDCNAKRQRLIHESNHKSVTEHVRRPYNIAPGDEWRSPALILYQGGRLGVSEATPPSLRKEARDE